MTDPLVLAQVEARSQHAVAVEWAELLDDLVIADDEQQEEVVKILRDVKERYRLIEKKRKEITVPLNQALKAVNDLFRPPREKFEALERLLKGKISEYADAKEAANVEALTQASEAETVEEAADALATVSPVAPPAGVSIRKVWKFEVTNPDLVPREYCSPDPKKIGAVDPTMTTIPGVRFFEDSVVTARKG